MANYAFGQLSIDRLSTVHPDLIKVAHRALRISMRRHDEGVDFTIPEFGGKRTTEDQQGLYSIGRTTQLDRKPVTRADGVVKKSNHQIQKDESYGHALDVIPCVKVKGVRGNGIYSPKLSSQKRSLYFHMVAVCMLQAASELGVRLSYGGNWRGFNDAPHYTLLKENR